MSMSRPLLLQANKTRDNVAARQQFPGSKFELSKTPARQHIRFIHLKNRKATISICDQTLLSRPWSLNVPPCSWGAFKDSPLGRQVSYAGCASRLPFIQTPQRTCTCTCTCTLCRAQAAHSDRDIVLRKHGSGVSPFVVSQSTRLKRQKVSEADGEKGEKRCVFFYLP